MIGLLNKKLKKVDIWDIGLIKWASIAGALFVIRIWSIAMNWVNSVNPWTFLIIFVILAAYIVTLEGVNHLKKINSFQ